MGGGPKISRFFFPFPPPFRCFCVSLGVFSWNFGGVLKRRCPQMCTFGVLRLSCASPGGPVWWSAGISHDDTESPNVHFGGPRPSKTPPKFNEKTPRETQKQRNGGGKGKKKSEILGGGGSREVQTSNNHNHNNAKPRTSGAPPALPSKV